jgi:hypothetical protein
MHTHTRYHDVDGADKPHQIYFPRERVRCSEAISEGRPFAFVEIYMDGFGRKGATGVYMRVSGIRSKYKSCQEFVKTLMVVPRGVDMHIVLTVVRRDVLLLEKGFYTFDSRTGCNVLLKGALSFLPADYVQACKNCRHMGNNATRNCKCCWVHKDDRLNVTIDILDHTNTRRDQQTDKVIEQMNQEIRDANLPPSSRAGVRTKYGVTNERLYFSGCTIDHHLQSFYDADHLYWFGVIPNIMNFCWWAMAGEQRKEFKTRWECFAWPSNTLKPWVVWGELTMVANVSMTLWKSIAMACTQLFDGLLHVDHYRMLLGVYQFIVSLYCADFTEADLPTLTTTSTELLEVMAKEMRSNPSFTMDRPNGHGWLEAVLRTLPAMVNLRLCNTDAFEAHHKWAVALLKGVRQAETFASKLYERRDTLQLVLHGTCWGSHGQHKLSDNILSLRDPRKGKSHLPHPLIVRLTNLLPQPVVEPLRSEFVGGGGWVPKRLRAFTQRQLPVHVVKGLKIGFNEYYSLDFTDNDDDIATYSMTQTMIDMDSARFRRLCVGDDVACMFNGVIEYATIEHLLVVTWQGTSYFWMYPLWYERMLTGQGAQRVDRLRLTKIVERKVHDLDHVFVPVPVRITQTQVMILHHCIRENAHFNPLPSLTAFVCKVKSACHTHKDALCNELSCCDKTLWDISVDAHDGRNPTYEVYERSTGFNPSYKINYSHSVL